MFKTIKYQINYPRNFEDVNKAKEWMKGFVDWYNDKHRHSGIKYVTPNQRHFGIDKKIKDIRKTKRDLKNCQGKESEEMDKE